MKRMGCAALIPYNRDHLPLAVTASLILNFRIVLWADAPWGMY